MPSFFTFSLTNRRLILLLIVGHLLWTGAILLLWLSGRMFVNAPFWCSGIFIALQLYAAAQLLLPALLLHPEDRTRGFYLFWCLTLLLIIWLINQLPLTGIWQHLLTGLKSGLLLLVATITGAVLARYVRRLWEVVPIALVMTLADFSSWLYGPTAGFTRQIRQYYLTPEGQPPFIDMILIKLALPGAAGLAPIFGISDWIMVVFFAIVARRHRVNDNLLSTPGETLAQTGRSGRYLPVSVFALFVATILAQGLGIFIPALPLIALIMFLWYALRYLIQIWRRC